MYPALLSSIRDTETRQRIAIERKIVKRLIDTALAANCELSVYDGEERHPWTSSRADVLKNIMNTDEDVLHIRREGQHIGSVALIYGNEGWTVIADYHCSLEDLLAPVLAYAETLED
jgi:hypothetical protein